MRRFPVPELTSRRDWMTGTRASPPPLSASSPCYPHVVPTRRTAEPLPSIRASETPPASTGDYFFQQTQLARVEPLCGCRPAEGCGTASNQSLTTVRSRPCQWRSGHVASRRVAVHAAPRRPTPRAVGVGVGVGSAWQGADPCARSLVSGSDVPCFRGYRLRGNPPTRPLLGVQRQCLACEGRE